MTAFNQDKFDEDDITISTTDLVTKHRNYELKQKGDIKTLYVLTDNTQIMLINAEKTGEYIRENEARGLDNEKTYRKY